MKSVTGFALLTTILMWKSAERRVSSNTMIAFSENTVPKYIVVVSMQRSSSSTVSRLLGSHPCSLNGNEIWTDDKQQDKLGAFRFTDIPQSDVPRSAHRFLKQVHGELCDEAIGDGRLPGSCEDRCTIAVKMFDIHGISSTEIVSMIEDPDFGFVVLERNAQDQFCSSERARKYDDWGTTPGTHNADIIPNEACGAVPTEFKTRHHTWFSSLRKELGARGKPFVEISFAAVASCAVKSAVVSTMGFFGFSVPFSLELEDDLDVVLKGCA